MQEFLEALKSASEVDLTVERAGKWTTRPVWFAVDGATVYLLPMYGADTKWYKYISANPEIQLSVRGKKVRAEAKPVSDAQKLAVVIIGDPAIRVNCCLLKVTLSKHQEFALGDAAF